MGYTYLFAYILTMQELKYKLFNKKICPICGDKMKSHLVKLYMDDIQDPEWFGEGKNGYQWFQHYLCLGCGHDFDISELCDSQDKNE
jgi:rRNA maturation endonuclease Nob1